MSDTAKAAGFPEEAFAERIESANRQLGELIDALLDLTRHTRREMHSHAVNLSSMAQSIAMEYKLSAPERDVVFVIAPNVAVTGDPRLIQVVLDNLIGNAWKFTALHETARIEFGVTLHGEKFTCFVKDDGAGFDMKYADKLFKPFQRLHSLHEFSGTGIGLATVQRIIQRHGGRIWAEAEVNKGATVYFAFA